MTCTGRANDVLLHQNTFFFSSFPHYGVAAGIYLHMHTDDFELIEFSIIPVFIFLSRL